MKKIVVLLAVVLADIILLNSVAATDKIRFMPAPYFPILLLFLTLIATLFLFYEDHVAKVHQQLQRLTTRHARQVPDENTVPRDPTAAIPGEHAKPMSASLVKSYLLRKKETPALNLQYQFIELLTSQITDLQSEGKSEQEILEVLKGERWDPQVIYLAMSRTKMPEQEKKSSS